MANDAEENAAAWLQMSADASYVEIHGAPYDSTVLDGRFTLAQLKAIVARLEAHNAAYASRQAAADG